MAVRGRARRFARSVKQRVLARNAKSSRFRVRRSGRALQVLGRGGSGKVAHMRENPSIAFRGSNGNKRAYVQGTPLDVWEIVEAYKFMGAERMLAEGALTKDEIAAALSYYKTHQEEIEQRIVDNRRSEDEWRELYPDLFALQ